MKRQDTAKPVSCRKHLERLLALSEGRTSLAYKLLPSARDFIGANTGVGGVSFRCVVGGDRSRVELFIASKDASTNESIFSELLSHRAEIEAAFDEPLSWERLDDSKSCRVAFRLFGGISDGEGKWRKTEYAIVDTVIRIEKALMPFLASFVSSR